MNVFRTVNRYLRAVNFVSLEIFDVRVGKQARVRDDEGVVFGGKFFAQRNQRRLRFGRHCAVELLQKIPRRSRQGDSDASRRSDAVEQNFYLETDIFLKRDVELAEGGRLIN